MSYKTLLEELQKKHQRNKKLAKLIKKTENTPNDIDLWEDLGLTLMSIKDFEDAFKVISLGETLDDTPSGPYGENKKAGYYANISYYALFYGHVKHAQFYSELGIRWGNSANCYLNLGHTHLVNGNTEEAVRAYARSHFAFEDSVSFWEDFQHDFEVMPQFNISREAYDALIPLIRDKVKMGPTGMESHVAYWSRGINYSAGLFDDEKKAFLEKLGYPKTFLSWLEWGNHNYSSEVISGDIDGFMYDIFNSEDLENELSKPENKLLIENDYLIFATYNQAEYYVFDKQNEFAVYAIRKNGFLKKIPEVEEIYEELAKTDAQIDFEKDPSLKFEDDTHSKLRVKSPYMRTYIQQKLFDGKGERYVGFYNFMEEKTWEVIAYLDEEYEY